MRKSMAESNPAAQVTAGSTGDSGFGSNFGHPLDMLARTAANTHSPDVDRFPPGTTYNGITPPCLMAPRPSPRVGPTETIPTTWSTELSSIDPVERGWLDIDDAKSLFERYSHMVHLV